MGWTCPECGYYWDALRTSPIYGGCPKCPMTKEKYEKTRAELVKERIRLMDILESQEDFPDQKLVKQWEMNKKQIIDLDCEWRFQKK